MKRTEPYLPRSQALDLSTQYWSVIGEAHESSQHLATQVCCLHLGHGPRTHLLFIDMMIELLQKQVPTRMLNLHATHLIRAH